MKKRGKSQRNLKLKMKKSRLTGKWITVVLLKVFIGLKSNEIRLLGTQSVLNIGMGLAHTVFLTVFINTGNGVNDHAGQLLMSFAHYLGTFISSAPGVSQAYLGAVRNTCTCGVAAGFDAEARFILERVMLLALADGWMVWACFPTLPADILTSLSPAAGLVAKALTEPSGLMKPLARRL
jgi:hypothetical protein